VSSADKGGSSDVDARTFWCKNIRINSKFVVCPYGQGEEGAVEPMRRGQFFAIVCGRPLRRHLSRVAGTSR